MKTTSKNWIIILIIAIVLLLGMKSINSNGIKKVQTQIGILEYKLGYPTDETIEKMRDEMAFHSATQIYIWSRPLAQVIALRDSNYKAGATSRSIQITEDYMTSDQVIPTANQATIYCYGLMKLEGEPMVLEVAPNILGVINDVWQRPITDIGNMGPDQGRGGKYIIIPPDYKGMMPQKSQNTWIVKSPTNNIFWLMRGFAINGDKMPAINTLKKIRIYKLSESNNIPKQDYINLSKVPFDGMPDDGYKYWKLIAKALQEEPVAERDRAIMALAKNIGIEKGKPFKPNARMKKILKEAAKVGEAMTKTIAFANRVDWAKKYDDAYWDLILLSKSEFFEAEHYTQIYERASYTYQAITVARPMIMQIRGKASKYLGTFRDADGNWLDGGKLYKLTVPANPPAKRFWSAAVYDTEIRSLIKNGTPKSTIGSNRPEVQKNADGSIDVYFGPKAPKGMESNWVKTIPNKGFFVYLRFYSPTEPYFDGSWKIGDIELVK
jgi:hypothetical protein